MVVHTSALQRLRQEDLRKFKTSLGCIVNSRLSLNYRVRLSLKNTNAETNEQTKERKKSNLRTWN